MSKDSERFRVWLDGGMVAPEDAKMNALTATAMRGANVYEGLRAYWDEVREIAARFREGRIAVCGRDRS